MKSPRIAVAALTLAAACCGACWGTEPKWDFRKHLESSEQLKEDCAAKWVQAVRGYVQKCDQWQTVGTFTGKLEGVPASFPVEEAKWVMDFVRPRITQEAAHATERVGVTSFFAAVTMDYPQWQLTHIGSIEAILLGGHKYQRLKCYGAEEFLLINGEPHECLPSEIFQNGCEQAADTLSNLDPSKAYIQSIPGTEMTAFLLFITPGDKKHRLGAWWRFVFVPVSVDCMQPLPLEKQGKVSQVADCNKK
jgi:hypothetical protein